MLISADPIADLNQFRRIRGDPPDQNRHGRREIMLGGHAQRISVLNESARKRPNSPDPVRRLPNERLSGFCDLGEGFAAPRKVWTDTFMAVFSYPSRHTENDVGS